MAIKIKEKDLTDVASLTTDDNIVYIPGFSTLGPVKKPTLCRTLKEFRDTFGYGIPKFNNDQTVEGLTLATAGEYDKSYLYACEVLNQGMPIVFESIGGTGSTKASYGPDSALATSNAAGLVFTAKSKYIGSDGNYIRIDFKYEGDNNWSFAESYKGNFKELGVINTKDSTLSTYYTKINTSYVDLSISGAPTKSINTASVKSSKDPLSGYQNYVYLTGGVNADFRIESLYTFISDNDFSEILDKNNFNLSFLSSGGYPTLLYKTDKSFVDKGMFKLFELAYDRGNVKSLIDINNVQIDKDFIANFKSFVDTNKLKFKDNTDLDNIKDYGSYADLLHSWGTYYLPSLGLNAVMPGSFDYLICMANSIKNNPDYLAIAGVNRGSNTLLKQLSYPILENVVNELQTDSGVSINSILNVYPYGYCIWGNRTLKYNDENVGLSALSFSNVRKLTNDVKTILYRAAKKYNFEQDTRLLWLNFKSEIEPKLDQMVSNGGLAGYQILKLKSEKRGTVKCLVRLVAIEPVENWDITAEITDSYISIE